ncbi:hypothetical protein HID58_013635, partial [Brassica napus]
MESMATETLGDGDKSRDSRALSAKTGEGGDEGSPWKKAPSVEPLPPSDPVDGVVSVTIPDDILTDTNTLWRCYVVGYFIGDAPHVGSIHATINRLWSSAKSGSKIDVQFIEKNTVSSEEGSHGGGEVRFEVNANHSVVNELLLELQGLPSALGSDAGREMEWKGDGADGSNDQQSIEVAKDHDDAEIIISPSRFSVLEGIAEDAGADEEELEEGEMGMEEQKEDVKSKDIAKAGRLRASTSFKLSKQIPARVNTKA